MKSGVSICEQDVVLALHPLNAFALRNSAYSAVHLFTQSERRVIGITVCIAAIKGALVGCIERGTCA